MEHLLDAYNFGEGEYEDALRHLDEIKKNGIANFPSLRPNQVDALNLIFKALKNQKRNIILIAPTGSGKSAIAATLAQIMHNVVREKSYILPPSRALQDQYIKDLLSSETFKVAKGADNYRCSILMRERDPAYRNGKVVGDVDSLTYSTAGSPCRGDREVDEEEFMSAALIRDKQSTWFKTCHQDQDRKVMYLSEATDMSSVVETIPEHIVSHPDFSVVGLNVRKYCRNRGACPHMLAREVADMAPAAILSLNMLCYYIHSGASEVIQMFGKRGVHIFDEAHNLEGAFREILSSSITQKAFNKFFKDNVKFSDIVSNPKDVGHVLKLLEYVHERCEKSIWDEYVVSANKVQHMIGKPEFKTVADYLKDCGSLSKDAEIDVDDDNYKKLVTWYKNTFYALRDYRKFSDRPRYREYHFWCEKADGNTLELNIAPITLGVYCKKFLAEHVNIYMSATIPDTDLFCNVLGLHPSTVEIINMPDPFPVQSHPIFLEPVDRNITKRLRQIGALRLNLGSVEDLTGEEKARCYDAGADSLYDRIAEKLKEVLQKFDTLSGVGFVTGYTSVSQIRRKMGDNDRLMFAESGEENRIKLEQFKKLPPDSNKVFISAGIKEGHSFDDDLSRLQFIFKVPFSPPDEILEILNVRYRGYSNVQTAIALQQQVGRSMRSKDDFCITVVFDAMFLDILKDQKHAKYYSQPFKDSIQWKGDWRNVVFDSEKISY